LILYMISLTLELNMHPKIHFSWLLILLTPFFFYVTHALAFFTHEYSHSVSAWIFGFKDNPLILNFGSTRWDNILLFTQMDENVNFTAFSPAHPYIASLIALSGMAGNVILYLIATKALFTKKTHSLSYYYFFIWLVTMNLGNFYDYIPARTFATYGDIGAIITWLKISPWWIMILLGYPVFYGFKIFYQKILPYSYNMLAFNDVQKAMLMIMLTLTLFICFGASGYTGYGPQAHFLALLSIYVVPIIIASCWPIQDCR
jgi:hypothetical protein